MQGSFCDIWNSGVYMFWGFCLVCYLKQMGCHFSNEMGVWLWSFERPFSYSFLDLQCPIIASWSLNVQGCFCMLAIVRWCLQMFREFNKLVDKNCFFSIVVLNHMRLLAWSEEVFWFVSRFAGMVVLLDRSICLWIVIWTTKHTGIKKVWSGNLIL